MGIVSIIPYLCHTDCNVGTVICHTLETGRDIRKDESQFDRTFSIPQSADMAFLHFLIQVIHDRFERFYFLRQLLVLVTEYRIRLFHNILHRSAENF